MTLDWYVLQNGLTANFVLDSLGNFAGVTGSSRDISNELDRAHLIKLRSQCDAVLVGGATARGEGYKKSNRFETYVFTKGATAPGLHSLTFTNSIELAKIISDLLEKHGRLLSECGPMILNQLLALGLVDELFLTAVSKDALKIGECEAIARQVLSLENYELSQSEQIETTMFTRWRRA